MKFITFKIFTWLSLLIFISGSVISQAQMDQYKTVLNEQKNCIKIDSKNIYVELDAENNIMPWVSIPYATYPLSARMPDQTLAWDVVDSLFFCIRVYSDNTGRLYPELRRFNLNFLYDSTVDIEKKIQHMYYSTSLITKILPGGVAMMDIVPTQTRIQGPIYFDISVNKDSLFYIFKIGDFTDLEVWKYFRTQPNPDRPLTPRDSIAWKQELEANPSGWKRVSNYNVTLTGPFKSFYHKGVCHIITHDMKVYRLGAKVLEPVDIRVKDPSKNCLLIDKRDQQVYLTRPPAAFGEGEMKKSMEEMMRDRELLFEDK